MNVIETIRSTIERHRLIPDGEPVVVGVSGGADSVALLHVLHALGIPLTVAHLNHRLRGQESDADETFVADLAESLGLPFRVKSVDVQSLSASGGLSIEMAARQARQDFFAGFGDASIALAHQADDQVETFMLKLARGAGTDGLGGMPYCRKLGNLRLIRPMLDLRRSAIVDWLQQQGHAWREDESNRDEHFLRNRVRHTVLPLLERELNPNIRETLLRTMDILREEQDWMNGLTANGAPENMKDMPRAARRRGLRRWLFDHDVESVSYEAVEGILALMDKGAGSTTYELNDRQQVVIEYGRPRLENRQNPPRPPEWILRIERGTGWRKDRCNRIGELPAEASFDAERVGESPIEVRTCQPGDCIDPLGMSGTCKLQDVFTDRKIPEAQRRRLPVVVCRGEIIWVPGYRIARNWAVQGMQGASTHVRIEQKPPA